MNINQINTLYQSKISEINQRLPQTGSVQNKFQELLEKAQLTTTADTTTTEATTTESTSETDPVKLLNSLMATQSTLNATSALFGSSDTSSMFPTSSLNNSLLSIQQSALLKSLTNNTEK